MKFKEFGFAPQLKEGLDAMGFENATPIQEQAIPRIIEGKDVLACAQTGTGKTAAFLLPILDLLVKNPNDQISALILEPTRELVLQVDHQLEAFSYFTGISSMAIYGGRGGQEMEMEKRALKKGVTVIVATPGRLTAHLDMGYANLENLQYLILDEADRMLDMGFAPAIMNIIHKLPRKRQNLLFSATMPSAIRKFARQIMVDPTEINIAVSKPAENIMQGIYEVQEEGKIPLTVHLLKGRKNLQRILIFASTKKAVKSLARQLDAEGMPVGAVHSDLEQDEREKTVLKFKNGTVQTIVATDVLSRGIDISGIDLVINYDVPSDPEDYVHRIGRTARAEASGIALTFVNGKDFRRWKRIEDALEINIRRMPLSDELEAYKAKPSKGRGPRRGGYSRKKGNNQGRGRGSSRKGDGPSRR